MRERPGIDLQDHYQVLGIAPDASAQVVRIAYEGRMKALADSGSTASADERRDEERRLKEAFVTLSLPAKRGPYDEKLRAIQAATEGSGPRRGRTWAIVAVAGVAVAILAFAVGQWRQGERNRLEADRVAKERAAMEAQRAEKARLEAGRAQETQKREAETAELAELARMGGGRGRLGYGMQPGFAVPPGDASAEVDPAIAESRREEALRAEAADRQARERNRAQMRQFQEDIRRDRMEERLQIEREKRLQREQRRR